MLTIEETRSDAIAIRVEPTLKETVERICLANGLSVGEILRLRLAELCGEYGQPVALVQPRRKAPRLTVSTRRRKAA